MSIPKASPSRKLTIRKVRDKLRQIELRKLQFRDMFQQRFPHLVNLTLQCLKNHYSERPGFLELSQMIEKMKRNRHLEFQDYKHRLTKYLMLKTKIIAEPENYEPKPSQTSSQIFAVENNILHSRFKSTTPKQVIQLESPEKPKLKVRQSIQVEPRPVYVEPKREFLPEPVESFHESVIELEKGRSQMKGSQYKMKIFDDSQDLYYRKIEKTERIQEVDFGSNFIGKNNGRGGRSRESRKTKKFIQISEV